MAGFNLDFGKWTWQHWLTTFLVVVLLYCLFFGCRMSVEFMENGGEAGDVEGIPSNQQAAGPVRQALAAARAAGETGGPVHGVIEDRVPGELSEAAEVDEVGESGKDTPTEAGAPVGYSGPANYGML